MATNKLRGKELRQLGYPEKKVISIALGLMERNYKKRSKTFKLDLLAEVLAEPENYLKDKILGQIAEQLAKPSPKFNNLSEFKTYKTFGESYIGTSAKQQMNTAMQLPITVAGALMPDAHHGYGLPIGGVLATNNAVIPYGVGVDIGCRMCLTIYDMPENYIGRNIQNLKKMLQDNTQFGKETFKNPKDHAVLERKEFSEIHVVRGLKDKAYKQIGSSGGGNHFVEFGEVEITDVENEFKLPLGKYLGILSHSGSRGLGAMIAKHYTDLAREITKLPKIAQHFAWLDLDTHEGQEYWLAMNLAGDYASACHHQIHDRLSKALGEKRLATVENHHNFAWKEKLADGSEVIVHRKGATPAGKGVLGVIPGTMTAPGYIVRGTGFAQSLASASHGAGRQMSRSEAKQSLTKHQVKNYLEEHGVTLMGGGLDEAPMAYKDIHRVMDAQQDLVEVLGSFLPKVVRMCGETERIK
ncbi:MAG: tRNA-splicing ligase RtcB [Flammeovirgaceae bacterium]|jgi:tRNA-splicing ligase RtcB